MAGPASTLSRRLSEVVGVALFASALIWLIALASYDPNDPVWFFSTGTHDAPANFVGRVGAFLAEMSFQLFGYGSYLLPAVVVIAGWHYFWCREVDAIYTKLTGAVLALSCTSAFMSLVLGSVQVGPRPFRAGGYIGDSIARAMSEYLSRTGSIIVILTLLFVAVILATQFSFGRLFATLFAAAGRSMTRGWQSFGAWREERRKARQRREVIAKHVKKGTASPDVLKAAAERAARPEPALKSKARITPISLRGSDDEDADEDDGPRAASV